MRSWLDWVGRGLGLAAVILTLVLSLPGIQAVRADDGDAPDMSVGPSFEGFARHMQEKGRPVARVESAGPTCSAQDPISVEMAHRQAIARMQAQMIADARARAAAGGEGTPEIVQLNGRGYNYRDPMPGENLVAGPERPAN